MQLDTINIKEGVKLHIINTNKFKTNLISIFLTSRLTRETITKKALILSILRRGSKELPTQQELNTKLEEMYGAECDCGIDKNGDNHISKFYIESVNDKYLPNKEEILEKSINILLNIIFNPVTEQNKFKQEYFEAEKENLKQIIESRKDNKRNYSTIRCIEEMYKNEPYGLYKYGYVEDLDKINNEELYSEYKELIENSKIDIFISGNIEKSHIQEIIENNKYIKDLKPRKYEIKEDNEITINKEKEIVEHMGVAQGNLCIGLKLDKTNKPVTAVYNAILGGGANSKLFQNVREKASLAYSAGSMYIKTKNSIIIKCGIDPENYQKTLEIVKQQLEDMKEKKISAKNLEEAKRLIVASFKSMQDEQDSEISYYFGKEINNDQDTVDEYIDKIKNVSLEDIQELAQTIKIDTIYFLTK